MTGLWNKLYQHFDRMTGFDIIVLIVVGVAAVGGFLRGFVQEVLSLASWGLAIVAINTLHTPVYEFLLPYVKNNDWRGYARFRAAPADPLCCNEADRWPDR